MMFQKNIRTGVLLSFVSLFLLGLMPVISNSRPMTLNALNFALFLSLWQLVFSLPLFLKEYVSADNRGIFSADLTESFKRKTIIIILTTGTIFGISTFVYVVAMEKTGAVSASIAIQAYPLFAILWETIFLNRKKSKTELFFTFTLLIAIYYLGTGGTWFIEGISWWFMVALGIPFLWSIAHVIIKEVLDKTPITPNQVTFFRVLVSSIILSLLALQINGFDNVIHGLTSLEFQMFAVLMGFVYYLELINWFNAVKHVDVSLASSIT
ncbi:MAG: EamA family transporter, partial [Desulfatitalea sp.]|nr:EamA family transporter [Desulfatitalea sp.]